jgi:putative tryptophan/tyrosine transport system substrate-binding protein
MRRREFITLLGGAATAPIAWPRAARAQQPERMRRIGVLMAIAEGDPDAKPRITAFEQRLQALGWTIGRNIRIDYRWPTAMTAGARADFDLMLFHVKDLAATRPDAILATGTPMVAALKHETGSVPIVFVQVADPVGSGLVPGLARPGENITGFTNYEYSIGGKWLEMLKEIAPHVVRVMFIVSRNNAAWPGFWRVIEAAAPSFGVEVSTADFDDAAEIEGAIAAFARERNGGLIVQPDQVTVVHRELISTLAARNRLPAVYPFRTFATIGGLMSYGIDVPDMYRQAAGYIDRILRGEKPADLPVQAPTKFELVINLRTANALGLTVSPTLLARADEVIE